MPADESAPVDLPALLALLGGRLTIDQPDPGASICPACSVPTRRSPAGHATYCLACTEAELGITARELSIIREHRISVKRWRECETMADIDSPHWRVFRRVVRPQLDKGEG